MDVPIRQEYSRMCRNLNIILQIRGDSEWFAINVVDY